MKFQTISHPYDSLHQTEQLLTLQLYQTLCYQLYLALLYQRAFNKQIQANKEAEEASKLVDTVTDNHGEVSLRNEYTPYGENIQIIEGNQKFKDTELRGGKFRHGFISGIVGKASGAVTEAFQFEEGSSAALYGGASIAALFGGLAAEATGGEFSDGALSAVVVYLFNDLAKALREFNSAKQKADKSVTPLKLLKQFMKGENRSYSFDKNHKMTKDMRESSLLRYAIEKWKKTRFHTKKIGEGDLFKLAHFLLGKNIDNLTRQFVGLERMR